MTAKKTNGTKAKSKAKAKPTKAKKAPAVKTKPKTVAKTESVTAKTIPQALKQKKLVERKGITLWDPAAIISTVFSVGRIPVAPGTWGSLFGVATYQFFLILPIYVYVTTANTLLLGLTVLCMLIILYLVGILAIRSYQSKTKIHDASEIVYDEFFGQILTYTLVMTFYVIISTGAINSGLGKEISAMSITENNIRLLIPFLYFRLFDVCKPWPINVVDKRDNSPAGVMFDDVLAAFYAASASIVTFLLLDNFISY